MYDQIIEYIITGSNENNSKEIIYKNIRILDKLELINIRIYLEDLWEFILKQIQHFNKEYLFYLSEILRECSCQNFDKELQDVMIRSNEIGIYIQKAILSLQKDYENVPFEKENMELLIDSIIFYDNLSNKLEYASSNNNYEFKINSLFDPIEESYIEHFFVGNDMYYRAAKIEEMTVSNQELEVYLRRKKLLPDTIFKKNTANIKEVFGFTYDDIEVFLDEINLLLKMSRTKKIHIFRIKKSKLIYHFKNKINKENLEHILYYLTLNNYAKTKKNLDNRVIELKCIYENKSNISFGLFTIKECLTIFKNITISGHYFEILNVNPRYIPKFADSQKALSTFFSYLVGDTLQKYGYLLPQTSDGIIEVEIKKIVLGDTKLHFNDIDVLAIDKDKKIIYNCELKYYQAKINYKSLEVDSMSKKKFENLMKREDKISQYKDKIINKLFNIDGSRYTVKTIVITSRKNGSKHNIQTYCFQEFIEKLERKQTL